MTPPESAIKRGRTRRRYNQRARAKNKAAIAKDSAIRPIRGVGRPPAPPMPAARAVPTPAQEKTAVDIQPIQYPSRRHTFRASSMTQERYFPCVTRCCA
jgi:hypothetical protein